ncbi:MAG: ribonuclease J [Alphaproteobacteria bacterium]|nr:ribonuclease J [Alphaproteobacteria bacterium]
MKDTVSIPRDRLVFVALGGAGEIGMNLYLYGYKGKWLMVDLGISFSGDVIPSINVIMPDIRFIEERRKDIVGLVITHGHEDHLGAVPYLWSRLGCPVFATPFAAAILESKIAEGDGGSQKIPITNVPLSHRFDIGPFNLELITVTHSIPEPCALAIRTPVGTVLHTGDWKFDPSPLVGDIADIGALGRVGDEGVLAMVSDSTNVFVPGRSGSEAEVRDSLVKLFATCAGRIAVTCFASNVARLTSITAAAEENHRHVALVGRSLWRVVDVARRTGYLSEAIRFLTDDEAKFLPPDKVLYICTGSQGEPRSALARIAGGSHPCVGLQPGDTVIFSSRVIPGNERAIFYIQNQLVQKQIHVVTDKDHFVHVSGHPARGEMERMYGLIRPHIAIPVHGEMRHLTEHARFAASCQVPHTLVAEDGVVVDLAPEGATIIGHVPVGRLVIDGNRIMAWDAPLLRERRKLIFNGSAVVTLVVDGAGRVIGSPLLSAPGLLDPDNGGIELGDVVVAIRAAIARVPLGARRDDDALREAARLAVRRSLKDTHGKKPVTDVHLVRV